MSLQLNQQAQLELIHLNYWLQIFKQWCYFQQSILIKALLKTCYLYRFLKSRQMKQFHYIRQDPHCKLLQQGTRLYSLWLFNLYYLFHSNLSQRLFQLIRFKFPEQLQELQLLMLRFQNSLDLHQYHSLLILRIHKLCSWSIQWE